MKIQAQVESVISKVSGSPASIRDIRPCHGGSINESYQLELVDNRKYFLKTNARSDAYPGMFAMEFRALELLNAVDAVCVPCPLVFDEKFIVLEWFTEGEPAANWQVQMGSGLAELHRATQHEKFGFEFDNYLGTSLQRNNWTDSWLSFWREQRLGFQLELFSQQSHADNAVLQEGRRLLERLEQYLGSVDENPVLLHGDLWSGNAAATETGQPVIYDPASYYGHREAEIGMMRMFGGFTTDCEAAYSEAWPLPPGSEERIRLYRLYHELNHLNLFGNSYYESCLSTIRSLL